MRITSDSPTSSASATIRAGPIAAPVRRLPSTPGKLSISSSLRPNAQLLDRHAYAVQRQTLRQSARRRQRALAEPLPVQDAGGRGWRWEGVVPAGGGAGRAAGTRRGLVLGVWLAVGGGRWR